MTEHTREPEPREPDGDDDTQGHVFIDTFIDPRNRDKLSTSEERATDEQPEA